MLLARIHLAQEPLHCLTVLYIPMCIAVLTDALFCISQCVHVCVRACVHMYLHAGYFQRFHGAFFRLGRTAAGRTYLLCCAHRRLRDTIRNVILHFQI